jgi:hypothetical protein
MAMGCMAFAICCFFAVNTSPISDDIQATKKVEQIKEAKTTADLLK